MFLSRKFANTRSTKALRDYFALAERQPTSATLRFIDWYLHLSQQGRTWTSKERLKYSQFMEPENFLLKYGSWSGGQYFRRALTFAYLNLFSFLKRSSASKSGKGFIKSNFDVFFFYINWTNKRNKVMIEQWQNYKQLQIRIWRFSPLWKQRNI